MGRMIIASPNRIDSMFYPVGFSGGAWVPELPLANLADPDLSAVTRSADAAKASTQWVVDLGVPRDILVVALPDHNLSRTARVRVRAYADAGLTTLVAEAPWSDVWRVVYPWGTLPWGHPSFADGKVSAEEAVGYAMPYVWVFPALVIARYWLVEIDDTLNPDGYVELSRLFLAPGYRPRRGFSYGATVGWATETGVERSLGGTRHYDERPMLRVMRVAFSGLTKDELMAGMFDIQGRQGVSRQVFVIRDPDDAAHLHRTSFVATLEDLPPIEDTYAGHGSVAVNFVEAR